MGAAATGDLLEHLVRDGGNQVGRHFSAVQFQQVRLDLAYAHATGVHTDHMVVKAGHAALVLGDQLGLEAAKAVTGDVEPHLAARGHYGLHTRAVTVVASLGLAGQVVIQFGGQHALCEQLLELARQAGLAQNRFGILVLDLGQQLVDQFDRDEARCFLFSWFFGGHGIGHGISLSVLFHDPGHTKNLTRSVYMIPAMKLIHADLMAFALVEL